jgi:hypothetical protein
MCAPVAAQDVFGTWQGSVMTPTRPPRMVFDLGRDNGRVKAFLVFVRSNAATAWQDASLPAKN